MSVSVFLEQKECVAPMSNFKGAKEMAGAIQKNQQRYYPKAKPVALPLLLGDPVVDHFFLSTIEGKFISGICRWLVQKGQIAEGKITKMYEAINTYLARGTCAGQAKTFLLNRRLGDYDGTVELKEKVSSVFFQACQKLESDLDAFHDKVKAKKKKNAKHLYFALEKMRQVQKEIAGLAKQYWMHAPKTEENNVKLVAEEAARIVKRENKLIKWAKNLSDRIQKLKRESEHFSRDEVDARTQLKSLESFQERYWREKGLGVIAKESYSRTGCQKGFSYFASKKIARFCRKKEHESVYIVMQYDNSTAHAILFQPARLRLFDLQAGVASYASNEEFAYDFKKYLTATKCYQITMSAIGKVGEHCKIEMV